MQGATTTTSTKIWMMVSHTSLLKFEHPELEGKITGKIVKYINDTLGIVQLDIDNLLPNKKYPLKYGFNQDGEINQQFSFSTDGEEISDFSFLFGSCTWPFKKKKKHWNIFDTMQSTPSDFMLWMGDNIYLLFKSWKTKEKIYQKYIDNRTHPKLNRFLSSKAHYAVWDDHDYGPNNSDATFENKELTLQAFKDFWANPSYGIENTKGVFYSFKKQDVEFFVLDNRFHHQGEELYGKAQMDWLKKRLKNSEARVKFIVGGVQFFATNGESWQSFPKEKNDFFDFIEQEKIKGLLFLSGDRHYTELTKISKGEEGQILEVTTSPLTSYVNWLPGNKNPNRVEGTFHKTHNFGHIHLLGKEENRKIKIEIKNRKGELLWNYEVWVNDLY